MRLRKRLLSGGNHAFPHQKVAKKTDNSRRVWAEYAVIAGAVVVTRPPGTWDINERRSPRLVPCAAHGSEFGISQIPHIGSPSSFDMADSIARRHTRDECA